MLNVMYRAILASFDLLQMVIKSTQTTTSWGITCNELRAGVDEELIYFQNGVIFKLSLRVFVGV